MSLAEKLKAAATKTAAALNVANDSGLIDVVAEKVEDTAKKAKKTFKDLGL